MDMQKMLREMQKMQGKMMKAQQELEAQNFEAEAGGGAVKIAINGRGQVTSVRLSPDVVDKEDVEALEDLLQAAFNTAVEKKDNATQASMGSLTQGMKIPGM
ncbi:MAG TPA: YbaB/EbfC family nucleoid-associated protein [Fibrobacteraceae bacterium]|nr:YbaB/EbfC family nucleoid-associated protein [Fibrobacteraceae bacterium]